MNTNRLEICHLPSKYSLGPHDQLAVDGVPLDRWLAGDDPNAEVVGLVPTLSLWLDNPTEKELVWSRVLPRPGAKHWLPILMCPDDCDLHCILVVVEVVADDHYVYWRKFGMELGDRHHATFGLEIKPIPVLSGLVFDRPTYAQFMKELKQQIDEQRAQ